MSVNRGAYRQEIASRLRATLTKAARVDDHQSEDRQVSPIVKVMSADGARRPDVESDQNPPQFRITVELWVIAEEATGYTLADAEQMIDDIEAEIAQWIEDNHNVAGWWAALAYVGFSRVTKVKIGGEMWLVESINLTIEPYTS